MLQEKWQPQEQCLYINLLEMQAVAKAILRFSYPPGATDLVSTDNSTIVFYIDREERTCSLSLWKETRLIFQLVINFQISIRAVHILGKMNVITKGAKDLCKKLVITAIPPIQDQTCWSTPLFVQSKLSRSTWPKLRTRPRTRSFSSSPTRIAAKETFIRILSWDGSES